MSNKHYHIVIIGAGPAGSACAIQLLQKGIKNVLLLEAGNFEKFRIGESIPPYANRLFQQMGIFDAFLKEKHVPCYGNASCWGSGTMGYNDFMLSKNGYGWHLDRTRFNRFLAQQAVNLGASLMTRTTYKIGQKLEKGFELQITEASNKPTTIYADMVVDASGKRSVFATQQGSQKLHTLPTVCLGMRFRITDLNQKITKLTTLEAAEHGWWYVAQIPNNQVLVAFYSDGSTIKQHQLKQKDKWLALLEQTEHVKDLVTGFDLLDKRPVGFAAPSYILDKISGKDWLAIGDAASAYDPITAQGITKALLNAYFAAEQIVENLQGQQEDFRLFNQYIQEQFDIYLKVRTQFYQMEERWINAPFWKKLREEKVLLNL